MPNTPDYHYPGGELELFAHATNWKAYWSTMLRPYLRGEVLEVGAGLGTNTALLRDTTQHRWVCLEPDPAFRSRLQEITRSLPPCDIHTGTTADLPTTEQFDAILYLDVLEHLADERAELQRAGAHLRNGGALIVLAPSLPSLFSPFDRALGHYRRYTKDTLTALAADELHLERLRYLDSCGTCLSFGNRLFLRQKVPSSAQLRFWDKVVVPLSRVLDRWTGYKIGKSILAIWTKEGVSEPKSR